MTNVNNTHESMTGGKMTGAGQALNMRREGMTHVDSRNSMTSIPQDYNQTTQRDTNRGHGFLKRLFFHYDIREIEAELQSIKLSKSDFVESTYAMSELGFFDLFFRMIPTISTAISALFIATIIYLILSPLSVTLGIIASFFFLQITIFQVGRIVYSLDKHKVGEKETGRFIQIVRTAWHFYEFIMVSILISLVLIYFFNVDWNSIANLILNHHFEMNFIQNLWEKVLSKDYFVDFITHLESVFNGLLLLFLLFVLSYSVVNFVTFQKNKKLYKDNLFAMKKEFSNPADLAREKFDF